MNLPIKLLLFALFSILVIFLSLRSLSSTKNHGFYRYFSWECIVWLVADNVGNWFDHPDAWYQIISWMLLFLCLYPALAGLVEFRKYKRDKDARKDPTLFSFEQTTELITTGIYRYIRHPMYASLVCFTWGLFFKYPGWLNLIIGCISTLFLYLTVRMEEVENIQYFGEAYRQYMKKSKRFIPFIF